MHTKQEQRDEFDKIYNVIYIELPEKVADDFKKRILDFWLQKQDQLLTELGKEVENLAPNKREVNYHQSYNEGKLDMAEDILEIIKKQLTNT